MAIGKLGGEGRRGLIARVAAIQAPRFGIIAPARRQTANTYVETGNRADPENCTPDPPGVLYLPHWTHRRLSAEVAASACVKQYEKPSGPPAHRPFMIRKDLLARFEACR